MDKFASKCFGWQARKSGPAPRQVPEGTATATIPNERVACDVIRNEADQCVARRCQTTQDVLVQYGMWKPLHRMQRDRTKLLHDTASSVAHCLLFSNALIEAIETSEVTAKDIIAALSISGSQGSSAELRDQIITSLKWYAMLFNEAVIEQARVHAHQQTALIGLDTNGSTTIAENDDDGDAAVDLDRSC